MLNNFKDLEKQRQSLLLEEKKKGKHLVAMGCSYVPEEIILAGGLHPVRLFAHASETLLADAYLYSNTCSFLRSCLEEALRGQGLPLDGLILCNTCDHKRRLFDVWKRYIKTPFLEILGVPSHASEAAIDFYHHEIMRLKKGLEATFNLTISEEAVRRATEECNEIRCLLRRLYEARSQEPPLVSGSEAMEVIKAGLWMPKERYRELLKEFLGEALQRKGLDHDMPRLLLTGSVLHDPQYLAMIEEWGGMVVADDLCMTRRLFHDLVGEDSTPTKALASYYLKRIPCPHLHPLSLRVQYLKAMARDAKVEGVIYETIKFCDNHATLFPVIKKAFEELGIPVLKLDREYTIGGLGQWRTRVEAFIESIRS